MHFRSKRCTRLTFQRTPLTGKNSILNEATSEQVAISPTKKKKATRNLQKRLTQTDDAPRQIAWTTEEEIALAKGWKVVSENSERGNARKKDGFWVEVMEYIESKTKMEGRRTYDMESGDGDEDYIQKAMIHYQAQTGLPFKFRHYRDVLKDNPKFTDIAFPNLSQWSQGSNKRHNSSGSSSFNTESEDANINLNNTVAGDDEVVADDDEVLVVNEMTADEVEQREKFIVLKRRDVECREQEIAATEYRAQQEDMKLYISSHTIT
ncbi:hypothetical protein Tco_1306539 [Tanacetum coccineum]